MEICWFNDLASFAVAWNSVPHKDLKQIFYNGDQQKVRYHMVNNEETRINGLSLFLSELHPSYEDEVNKHGGEFRIDFKSNLIFLQQLWEKLLMSVITNEFVNVDFLAGIRLLDKSTSTRENFFRIEIWTKFSDNEVALKDEMQKHLEEAYIQKMRENDYTFNSSKNRDRDAPLSDWIKFNNHSKDSKSSYNQQQPKEQAKEEALAAAKLE